MPEQASSTMANNTTQRVILVTGANDGIGFEVIKQLSEKHPQDILLLGSRDTKRGQDAKDKIKNNQNIRVVQLNVTQPESVDKAVQLIKQNYNGKLDCLVNNAGIGNPSQNLESAKSTNEVNYFGLKRMTHAFASFIPRNGSIINVTSQVGCWALDDTEPKLKNKLLDPKLTEQDLDQIVEQYYTDIKSGDDKKYAIAKMQDYAFSKNVANAFVRISARNLKDKGIFVLAVCPGSCATKINPVGSRTAAVGGLSVISAIESASDKTHGTFQQDNTLFPWHYQRGYQPQVSTATN